MLRCPVVLVIAGHDPTGGAGLQADIETLGALGCHAATVVTALTVQDTHGVRCFETSPPALVDAQARAVLEDIPVAAIKLGMLASAAIVEVVVGLMADFPALPVVLDPVMAGGGGGTLARGDMAACLRDRLVGRVRLLTPNSPELLALAPGAASPDAAATVLSATGSAVLATGGHDPGDRVINRLWENGQLTGQHRWPRLPHAYHGSGCTLASACAAGLASGLALADATRQAQQFTWHALDSARPLGRGQWIPHRVSLQRPPPLPDGDA